MEATFESEGRKLSRIFEPSVTRNLELAYEYGLIFLEKYQQALETVSPSAERFEVAYLWKAKALRSGATPWWLDEQAFRLRSQWAHAQSKTVL